MPNDKTEIIEYNFTDEERNRLYETLAQVEYNEAGPFNSFVRLADYSFTSAASSGTANVLHAFKNGWPESSVLTIYNGPSDTSIVRGLKEGELSHQGKSNSLSESFLVGCVTQVGEPYSIAYEGEALVNNLCPSYEDQSQLTGLGSRAPLDFHIENAAARLLPGDRSPDGLALTGVCKEPGDGPATMVADGYLALSLCDPAVEEELWKSNFSIRFPNRWLGDGMTGTSLRTSALRGPKESPSFVAAFYDKMFNPLTQEAERALAEFEDALKFVARSVTIEPGVTVVLNNHRVFHGRGSFKAMFDEDLRPYRWVQRVFYTSALRRMGEWEWVRDRVVCPVVGSEVSLIDEV